MVEDVLRTLTLFNDNKAWLYLKSLLNVVFVFTTTCFIYAHAYTFNPLGIGWDYNSLVNCIAKGEYIIPLRIYFIVWVASWFVGEGTFLLGNYFLSEIIKTRIGKFSFLKYLGIDKSANPQRLLNLFVKLHKNFSEERIKELEKRMEKQIQENSKEFVLLIRTVATITIAFIQINYFGWLLLTFLVAFIIFWAVSLILKYHIGVILIASIDKLKVEVKEIVHQKTSEDYIAKN